MPGPSDERALLDSLRADDPQAARQVVDEYTARLLQLARWRISKRLARRIDPGDVVQSAFRTFFHRLRAGKLTVAERSDLGKILVRITLCKVLRQVALHTAAKRDCSQEAQGAADSELSLADLPDDGPSPEAAIAFLDQLEHFLGHLNMQDRRVLEMRLQNYGTQEIAQELGLSDRHVRRVLEHIRAVAEKENIGG